MILLQPITVRIEVVNFAVSVQLAVEILVVVHAKLPDKKVPNIIGAMRTSSPSLA